MSRPWRFVAGTLAATTIGYSLWLLLIGGVLSVSDLSGSTVVGRRPVVGAIVPLAFGSVTLVGLRRESPTMIWTGAIGVLVYGLLSVFGMGVYMPIFGLLLVLAVLGGAITSRRGGGHPTDREELRLRERPSPGADSPPSWRPRSHQ